MEYHSIRQLEELCKTEQKPVWKIVLKAEQTETDETEKQIFERMRQMYHEMKAADEGYAAELRSASGMAGGDGEKMHRFNVTGKNLCSGYMALAMEKALKMGESNACMKRIVAAPTAGSAGIVPGLLLAVQKQYHFSDEQIQQALFNAGAIGYLAMRNATVAGAVGGCQAETGIAAAMAASAATELLGGTSKQCTYAASTVLMNMLGLVCDPVGGLVEYPCQNRNAAGVANALVAAEMALAGITQLIPLDEMINVMYTVGKKLPAELRETALGGCATAPSACKSCHMCS